MRDEDSFLSASIPGNPLLETFHSARVGGIASGVGDVETFVPVDALRDMAGRMARALREKGVRPGHRVGVRAGNTVESVALDFAIMWIGAISVLVPAEAGTLLDDDDISEALGLALMVADVSEARGGEGSHGGVTLRSLLNGSPTLSARRSAPVHEQDVRDGVYSLVFSSGSSGVLKALGIRSAAADWYVRRWGEVYPMCQEDRVFVGFPLSVFQQRYLIYVAIRYQCTAVLTDPTRVRQALKRARATVVLGLPAMFEPAEHRFRDSSWRRRAAFFLLGALPFLRGTERLQANRWQLGWCETFFGAKPRLLLVGSAPVRPSTLRHYRRAGARVYEIYGMTEVGFVTWNVPGAHRLGTSGRPVYEGSVRLAPDGEVVVAHPLHLCAGYAEPFTGAEAVFRTDGAVSTGDLGAFTSDGFLRLVGRKKNVIVTRGGHKVSPETIEGDLEAIPGVERAAVVLDRGDTLAAIIWSAVPLDGAQRRRVVDSIGRINATGIGTARIDRVAIVPAAVGIPTTRNLKLLRQELVAEYKGRLTSIASIERSCEQL